jgi:amphi-Trp domain-containing protein
MIPEAVRTAEDRPDASSGEKSPRDREPTATIPRLFSPSFVPLVLALPTPMPEEILFEFERAMSRADVAAYLRTVADKLDADGALSFTTGDQSHSVKVPDRLAFEVKVERESQSSGAAEIGVEFELEWDENGTGSSDGGALGIE